MKKLATLGHRLDRNSTSLHNYISVTPELATQAIRKVLDNLKYYQDEYFVFEKVLE